MESKEVRGLMEAYASVYNESMMRGSRPDSGSSNGSNGGSNGIGGVVDTVTSVIKPQVQKQANKKFGPLGGMVAGREVDKIGSQVKSGDYGGALNRAVQGAGRLFNSVDMFDIIKGHLLDEGYADTEQAALAIMANMSEEWRQSIVEQINPNASTSKKRTDPKTGKIYTPTPQGTIVHDPKKDPYVDFSGSGGLF